MIKAVKGKIAEISPGLPQKTLADGMTSRVRIVPFYDRTGLIYETLGTLETALTNEILVTIIVIVIMLMHLRSSLVMAGLLPLAVLICFIGMKLFGVDANIVALSGIAIAIGTMVDMGVILIENIYRHLSHAGHGADRLRIVLSATREVGGAVITAVLTTVVSFLPVLTMDGGRRQALPAAGLHQDHRIDRRGAGGLVGAPATGPRGFRRMEKAGVTPG